MKQTFDNSLPVAIDSGSPSDVQSEIVVSGLNADVTDVSVSFDVDHTYTDDLEIRLEGPQGQSVLLVGSEGGSGNNFRDTSFDDASSSAIVDAEAPFSGVFRPEESLGVFENQDPNGTWVLRISDKAWFDGGSLNRWSLSVTTASAPPSAFEIGVRFLGGLSGSQQAVFQAAADRWAHIIIGALTPVQTDIGVVDNVVIDAQGSQIDGISGILGQAGPTGLRPSSLLPARGIMSFDQADLGRMESDGSLLNVIIHEMGHVLGVGTIWEMMGLLQGAGTANPIFSGLGAMNEFATLSGANSATPVPVANTGGAGTADGHWRESVFGNELLTGFLNGGNNPLSRMSIAALGDMGYQIDLNAADPYTLPGSLELALMGIGAETEHNHDHCQIGAPTPVIYPPEAEEV